MATNQKRLATTVCVLKPVLKLTVGYLRFYTYKIMSRGEYLYNYVFHPALSYRAENLHGHRDGSVRFVYIDLFSKRLLWRFQSHSEVNTTKNALWLSNLVGKTPYQSVVHCWVKDHTGVSQSQPEVKLLNNGLFQLSVDVRNNPYQSIT